MPLTLEFSKKEKNFYSRNQRQNKHIDDIEPTHFAKLKGKQLPNQTPHQGKENLLNRSIKKRQRRL